MVRRLGSSAVKADHTAVFQRDGKAMWHVALAERPQIVARGRTLAQARTRIVSAAATSLELDPSEIHLTEDIRLSKSLRAVVDDARKHRESAQAATETAAEATREAARRLVEDEYMTLRDAGEILGLSHQRVQQLLSGGARIERNCSPPEGVLSVAVQAGTASGGSQGPVVNSSISAWPPAPS